MAKAKNTNHTPDELDGDDDIADPVASTDGTSSGSQRGRPPLAQSGSQRGRPPLAQMALRPPKGLIKAEKLTHPMRIGVTCPGCGRVVTPRIIRTEGAERTVECTSCKRLYRVGYNAEGWPVDYRFIR